MDERIEVQEDALDTMIKLFEERLDQRLAEQKRDILEWWFILWVAQLGAMLAFFSRFAG